MYEIQILNAAGEWKEVYEATAGDGGIDDISFEPADTRYVRITGYGSQNCWFFAEL